MTVSEFAPEATPATLPGEVDNLAPGLRGIDTAADRLTQGDVLSLFLQNYRYVARYVSLQAHDQSSTKYITHDEGALIINGGLGLMLVQSAPNPYTVGVTNATNRANAAVVNAQDVGYQPSATLFLDIENVPPGTSATAIIAYCTTWVTIVRNGAYSPGLYLGAGSGLSADQLGGLPFDVFWKSGSNVPTPTNHGFALVQDFPFNKTIPGVHIPVDTDTSQNDLAGKSCRYERLAL